MFCRHRRCIPNQPVADISGMDSGLDRCQQLSQEVGSLSDIIHSATDHRHLFEAACGGGDENRRTQALRAATDLLSPGRQQRRRPLHGERCGRGSDLPSFASRFYHILFRQL